MHSFNFVCHIFGNNHSFVVSVIGSLKALFRSAVGRLATLTVLLMYVATAKSQVVNPDSLASRTSRLIENEAYDAAVATADTLITYAKAKNLHAVQARALGLKGKALFHQDKKTQAVNLFFEGLNVAVSPDDNKEIAFLNKEIGYAYYVQGHYQEAKDHYLRELAILRQLGGRDSVWKPLINLSVMYQMLKQYDSSMLLLNELGEIAFRRKNLNMQGYYYLNKGSLLLMLNQLDSATEYFNNAYDVWKQVGNVAQIYKTTFNLGFTAKTRGDDKKALEYYHLSEDAALKYGLQKEIAHVYGTMAEAYADLNDYKNAYNYLFKYALINDTLHQNDFNDQLARLDRQFNAEKNAKLIKEQQLKLETTNLRLQKQQNTILLIVIVLVILAAVGGVVLVNNRFNQKVQQEVERAKERFFSNVVHEIRTPLSMVQAPIKLLQQQISDPDMRQQLDIADRNAERLNELVTQMLDISKMETARYRLNEAAGDLSLFINRLSDSFAVQASDRQLSFVKCIEPEIGNVYYDNDALQKIVDNLLGNAIKYTPPGGSVGMDVSVKGAGEIRQLHLYVWDTGVGIRQDELDKVFQRFYRAKNATGDGAGIGLSLVKELVTLMHGTISVQSRPGEGSVFSVMVPLRSVPPVASTGGTDGAPVVLLVEDDHDIRQFNASLLSRNGYHILTAHNGEEAYSLMQEQMPDLVITDVMMPVKDGIALIKELAANPALSHIPVMVLSAKASLESRLQGLEVGALAYLAKPFMPQELLSVAGNLIQYTERQKKMYQQQMADAGKSVAERYGGIDPFTKRCYELIEQHLDDAQLSVERLAEMMHVNRSHFQRKIKALTGFSPSDLIRSIRLEAARQMLRERSGNITETAYASGFTSQSYFTKCYTDHFGYPPSQEAAKVVS